MSGLKGKEINLQVKKFKMVDKFQTSKFFFKSTQLALESNVAQGTHRSEGS